MTKPNPPQHLPASGTWTDFDESETPLHPDTTVALASLTDVPGVHFVTEFVKQYAEQQGYSEQRRQALEQRAHDAIERWLNGREGHALRLVNRIDGHPIDTPSSDGAVDAHNALWRLTNTHEFNAFLEALGETGRWQSQQAAEVESSDTNTPTKNGNQPTPATPLANVIELAIEKAGGLKAGASRIWSEFCQLAEAREPMSPLTGVIDLASEGKVKVVEVRYRDFEQEERGISLSAFRQRIRRLQKKAARRA